MNQGYAVLICANYNLKIPLIDLNMSLASFKVKYIDPKDHKSEEDIKAIAVEGAIWPKSSNRMPMTGWFSPARWRSNI